MHEIICTCDDGFSTAVNVSASTTPKELLAEICRFRNIMESVPYHQPDHLCIVTTDDIGQIVSLICPDVSVHKCYITTGYIKVIGFQAQTSKRLKTSKRACENIPKALITLQSKRSRIALPSVEAGITSDHDETKRAEQQIAMEEEEEEETADQEEELSNEILVNTCNFQTSSIGLAVNNKEGLSSPVEQNNNVTKVDNKENEESNDSESESEEDDDDEEEDEDVDDKITTSQLKSATVQIMKDDEDESEDNDDGKRKSNRSNIIPITAEAQSSEAVEIVDMVEGSDNGEEDEDEDEDQSEGHEDSIQIKEQEQEQSDESEEEEEVDNEDEEDAVEDGVVVVEGAVSAPYVITTTTISATVDTTNTTTTSVITANKKDDNENDNGVVEDDDDDEEDDSSSEDDNNNENEEEGEETQDYIAPIPITSTSKSPSAAVPGSKPMNVAVISKSQPQNKTLTPGGRAKAGGRMAGNGNGNETGLGNISSIMSAPASAAKGVVVTGTANKEGLSANGESTGRQKTNSDTSLTSLAKSRVAVSSRENTPVVGTKRPRSMVGSYKTLSTSGKEEGMTVGSKAVTKLKTSMKGSDDDDSSITDDNDEDEQEDSKS
eukprot:gene5891-11898_t